MGKRIGLYYGLGLGYLVLLHRLMGGSWVATIVLGVPYQRTTMIFKFFIFFFAILWGLIIFDYAQELFYHQNIVKLIRTGSRIRSYLAVLGKNISCLVLVWLGLGLTGLFLDRQFSAKLLPLALVQLLAIVILGIGQTIIEIKWSGLAALLVVVFVSLIGEFSNSPLLGLLQTMRLSYPPALTIGVELGVILILVIIGAFSIRKQEIR